MSDIHEFQKQNLETDFGQKVDVSRETKTNDEAAGRAADALLHAGTLLNPKPGVLEYLGAAAVHIYRAPALQQVFFVSQYPLGGTSEELASKALTDLRGSLMEAYGRKRQIKRSGF